MMLRGILLAGCAGLAALAALAQSPPPPASAPTAPPLPVAEAELIRSNAAVLRGLDKVTGKAKDFTVSVNKPTKFGTLELTVKACAKAPDTEAPETYVFLEVKDFPLRGVDGTEPEPVIYPGRWLFASSPALNALEHPVYDVWVISCRT